MHFQIGGQCDFVRVNFQAIPARALSFGSRAPARGAKRCPGQNPWRSVCPQAIRRRVRGIFSPARRPAQSAKRQMAADGNGRGVVALVAEKKSGALRVDGAGLVEQFTQAEPRERSLAAAADEFAADAMAGIMPRLVNHRRHIASPQSDAEHQAGEAAADNRDGFCPGHGSTGFPRGEEMAEGSGAVFRQPPVLFVRPGCRKFVAGKTRAHAGHGIMARDLVATKSPTTAGCKTAATTRAVVQWQ